MTSPANVFVHERALCESDRVGPGTRIWAFAHVMEDAVIGADCNICGHAFVESGAVIGDRVVVKNAALIWDRVAIGDDVFIGPNAVFTNDIDPRAAFKKDPDEFLATTVEDGVTIGAQATIVCGVTIGKSAFIGAGALVISDVAPHALVVGNPAQRIGWACECGRRLSESLDCTCGRAYALDDPVDGLVSASGST